MGFNEQELLKIYEATSGLFKKRARKGIAQALQDIKPKIEAAKKLSDVEKRNNLMLLANKAKSARHQALRQGANSYGHPQWAAAASCESWLHELIRGDPEGIRRVEELIQLLSNRG